MAKLVPTAELVPGEISGECIVVEPFSFWGGFDVSTGCIAEPSHPSFGTNLSGRVLVMASGRGSSSSSSVLAEGIRLGTAPQAILVRELDMILVTGALVARQLYGIECSIIQVSSEYWGDVVTASFARRIAPGQLSLE